MKFGVSTNYTWFGPPIVDLARRIEELGFESLWMGEHPVIPVSAAEAVRYGVPLPENYRHMPDQMVSLTAAAVATTRLKLGTNICIVPQHDPIQLAKQTATLDRVSNGRLIFAYGTGWIEEEAEVFGYRFDQRLGVKAGLVEKSGAWFSYDSIRIGQGRENAKQYLKENPEVCDRLEAAIRGRTDGLAEEMMAGPDAEDDI